VEDLIHGLGEWQGTDPKTGFQLVQTAEGKSSKLPIWWTTTPAKRERVAAALRDGTQKNNREHVDIIIALGMAKEGFDWI